MTKTDFPLNNSIAIAVSKLTALTNKSKNTHKTCALTYDFGAESQKHAFCVCFGHLPLSFIANTNHADKNEENYNEGIISWSTTVSNPLIFVFHNLSRYSAVITMILPLLLLLVSWGQKGTNSAWGGFSENL